MNDNPVISSPTPEDAFTLSFLNWIIINYRTVGEDQYQSIVPAKGVQSGAECLADFRKFYIYPVPESVPSQSAWQRLEADMDKYSRMVSILTDGFQSLIVKIQTPGNIPKQELTDIILNSLDQASKP